MECPLCRKRPARRPCPALGREICPACCGTKRQREIACPADCRFLVTALAHPAAVVRRQQARDLAFGASLMRSLGPGQGELCWGLLGVILSFAGDPLFRLEDVDVIDAASAFAATMETSSKGVIYEHRPASLVAQRLVSELKAWLEEAGRGGARIPDRDVQAVLVRVADSFKDARRASGPEDPARCLGMVGRLYQAAGESARHERDGASLAAPGPALIRP